jgi:hypothetical protein
MVVIGLAVLMQVFVLLTPLEWLHMPEREYWLAPERRAVTLDRLSSFAAMLFGVVLLGVQAGFELAAQANLHRPIEFNAPLMFAAIALCVVLSLGLLWGLMLSFRVPAPRV